MGFVGIARWFITVRVRRVESVYRNRKMFEWNDLTENVFYPLGILLALCPLWDECVARAMTYSMPCPPDDEPSGYAYKGD